MDKSIKLFLGVALIGLLVIAGFGFLMMRSSDAPGKYYEFAACTAQKGAVFYGAFWCQHCQAQKAMFGKAIKNVKYVECSTADAQGQTKECQEKQIASYPTWIFADGSRLTGEVPMSELASKTGCELPK